MSFWRQDLTYAFRRLSKSPGFAAAAAISIGLGIAANSTIFSMVSRFVLRPPPVGDPATLLALHTTQHGECCNRFTWPMYVDLRNQAKTFSGVAAFQELLPASIAGQGEPERVWGQSATTNFFDVTQMRMALGRGFLSTEQRLPVVVLGYTLWQRHFAADPNIAGRTVTLSGRPFTVVGVAAPGFHGLDQIIYTQFWVPVDFTDQLVPHTGNFDSRDYNWLAVVARLKPGATRAQASAELDVLARNVAKAYPASEKDRGFLLQQAGALPPRDRPFVMMFLAAFTVVALLVLSIACANVANLFLAQASGRQKEIATRRALGGTRAQIMRHLLTESIIVALAGGALGVALSVAATQALSSLHLPAPVPLDVALQIDWRTLLYTFALSAAAGVLCGFAPSAAATRGIHSDSMKGDGSTARPGSRWSLRNILVVTQVAVSLVLLCATGLFLRSLQSAANIDIGFRSSGLLMMSVDPRLHGYSPERITQFANQLQARAAALPGVTSAAVTDVVPLTGGNRSDAFTAEGRPAASGAPVVDMYMATPGYFDSLGITRVAGRDFSNDSPTAPKVAIVNETFAHKVFPNENPIGRRVNGAGVVYQIVGVVKDIRSRTLGEDLRPVLFRSLAQTVAADPSLMGYTLLVRTGDKTSATLAAVRREIRSLDPSLAIYNVETMEEHFKSALFLARLTGGIFGVFGAVGMLLAAVGLYGVMSYSVSRRTREMGIRMALGSPIGAVQRLVVRQGMVLTLIAMAIGIAAAWAAAKFSASVVYGVRPHDPVTFVVVPLFLAAVALLACWIPARRAEKVDPLTALRHD